MILEGEVRMALVEAKEKLTEDQIVQIVFGKVKWEVYAVLKDLVRSGKIKLDDRGYWIPAKGF